MLENHPYVVRIVRLALEEDLGTGDLTTEAVVPLDRLGTASVVAKEAGVLAGLPVAVRVLREVDPDVSAEILVADGSELIPGTEVLRASGRAASLLVAERTLLDFVMRLSGIATHARRFAKAIEGAGVCLLDTRKTTPGLRVLEKYAVRMGGVRNHRMSLAGGILVKNNHIAACGSVTEAVEAARRNAPLLAGIEVEVRTIEEARLAKAAGADVLLLDHMGPDQAAEVVAFAHPETRVEVSGNLTPESAAAAGRAGVDFVSAGSLTYGARWLDFSMSLRMEGGTTCSR
jgi:nicotinate-nucleotide pyrophosphorylase (carboxylating)